MRSFALLSGIVIFAAAAFLGWKALQPVADERNVVATTRVPSSTPSLGARDAGRENNPGQDQLPHSPEIKPVVARSVRKPLDFQAPPGKYRDTIPGLRERARAGDSESAYVLARLLVDCYYVSRGQPSGMGSNEPDRCEGVTNIDSKEAIGWFEFAADHGNIEAQVLYPAVVSTLLSPEDMMRDPLKVMDYKSRSMAYLNSAASHGSGQAIGQLASAYYHGVLTDKNLIMAYAYYYVLGRIVPSGGDDPSLIFKGDLSAAEIANARTLSEQIYHHCCG